MTIRAITFDLWDTLVIDDSDEPKRRVQGLPAKRQARRQLVLEALARHAPVTLEQVTLGYDVADAAFDKVWHDQHVTWTITERLEVLLRGLGRELPAAELQQLAEAHGRMEVDIPPDPIAGVEEALAALKQRYRLCVVSDAIVTPGAGLRELLEKHGLARFFDGFVFSDEVGHSKPHRSMFDAAARALDVELGEMVHIGDRQQNDVAGPQALGMRAVLFVGSRATERPGNTADAVCERYDELPDIVNRLAQTPVATAAMAAGAGKGAS